MALLAVDIGDAFKIAGDKGISDPSSGYSTIGGFIGSVLPNVYIGAGLIIFFMIVAGGFLMIANSGNTDKQQEGKSIITAAIIGFVIVFTSYWIIQIVQIVTGLKILNSGL